MAIVRGISAALAVLVGVVAATTAQAGERYAIDRSHTLVQFSVDRFGFNAIIGTFFNVEGSVLLDDATPSNSSVEARIVVASLTSGDATRDGHLAGALWFNAARFPEMTFRSTSVAVQGGNMARVTGDLTILGVARPVTLDVRLNKRGIDPATKLEAAGFSATAQLKRSDFGMTTAGKLIGDEVQIRIEALTLMTE